MSNNFDSNIKIQQSEPEKITNGLDPRLQEVILKTRDGTSLDASFSHQEVDGAILVDVLAVLKSPDRDVPKLKIICRIGNIVTGQVLVSDIEVVRNNQNVESLKLAEKLRPELNFSVNEINNDDGTTRLISLWDQRGGSTCAAMGFDELLTQTNRAIVIVIATDNSHNDRSHAQGNVTDSSPRTLTWQIHPEDDTSNEIEIWYDGNQELEVALETPSGQRLNPISLGTTVTLRRDGAVVRRIIHRTDDPHNGDNYINIILAASLSGGNWKVFVSSGTTSDSPTFISPITVATTALSSNGNSLEDMVLTAAKAATSSKSRIKIQIEFEPV